MRINSTSNISFSAILCGDTEKIKKLAVSAGVSERTVKKTINSIHKFLPNKEDKIYLYLKKYVNTNKSKESVVRAGIKIVKNNEVMEKSIDPRDIPPKNLLYRYIDEIKALVSGKTKPDESLDTYTIPRNNWLDRFDDKDTKLLVYTW